MNILITPALSLTSEQREKLSKNNKLFFIETELTPIEKLNLEFSLNDIDGIVCNHFFTVNNLSVLPNLKFIHLTSAGVDRVNVDELQRKNIKLFTAGSTYTVPIAEWVVCQILSVYKNNDYFFEMQKHHIWKKNRSMKELSGSTVAIIGYGNIGRAVAKRLKAFDLTIHAVDIAFPDGDGYFDNYYDISELKEAVCKCDIVVVCAPLTNHTYHIIDKRIFSCLKDDVLLINPSRGALIDEISLIEHIKRNPNFFAVLDVFEEEPLNEKSFFWDCDHVRVSPHNGFESRKNKDRLFELIYSNLCDLH